MLIVTSIILHLPCRIQNLKQQTEFWKLWKQRFNWKKIFNIVVTKRCISFDMNWIFLNFLNCWKDIFQNFIGKTWIECVYMGLCFRQNFWKIQFFLVTSLKQNNFFNICIVIFQIQSNESFYEHKIKMFISNAFSCKEKIILID